MRAILLLAVGSLAGCATLGTPGQSMYTAYSYYSVAVMGAVDYAEGPTADPKVVRALNAANKRPEVRAAVTYGRAYVLCHASNSGTVIGTDCSLFDFRASTASAYAVTLRSAAIALLQREAK